MNAPRLTPIFLTDEQLAGVTHTHANAQTCPQTLPVYQKLAEISETLNYKADGLRLADATAQVHAQLVRLHAEGRCLDAQISDLTTQAESIRDVFEDDGCDDDACGASIGGGEGYDGYCGPCADKREAAGLHD